MGRVIFNCADEIIERAWKNAKPVEFDFLHEFRYDYYGAAIWRKLYNSQSPCGWLVFSKDADEENEDSLIPIAYYNIAFAEGRSPFHITYRRGENVEVNKDGTETYSKFIEEVNGRFEGLIDLLKPLGRPRQDDEPLSVLAERIEDRAKKIGEVLRKWEEVIREVRSHNI